MCFLPFAQEAKLVNGDLYQKKIRFLENDFLIAFDSLIDNVKLFVTKLQAETVKLLKDTYNAFIDWGQSETYYRQCHCCSFFFLFAFIISHLLSGKREHIKIFLLRNNGDVVYHKVLNYSCHLIQYFFLAIALLFVVIYMFVNIFDIVYDERLFIYFVTYTKIFFLCMLYSIGLRFLYFFLSWFVSVLSNYDILSGAEGYFFSFKNFLNFVFTPISILQRVLLISKYENNGFSKASEYMKATGETLAPFQQLLQLLLMVCLLCLFSFLILRLKNVITVLFSNQGRKHNFAPLLTIGRFWCLWSFIILFSVFRAWFNFVSEVDVCYLFLAVALIVIFTVVAYLSPVLYDGFFDKVTEHKSIKFYIERVLQWTILIVALLTCDLLLGFVKIPLLSFLLNSSGFALLHDVLLSVLFGICAIILANVLQSLTFLLVKRGFPQKAIASLNKLISKSFWLLKTVIKLLLLLSILEKWLTPSIPLILFIAMIALGIGSREAISTLFKSIVFLISSPIKEGDKIVVATNTLEAGIVVNLGLFNLEMLNEHNKKTIIYYTAICSFRHIGKEEGIEGLSSS